MSFRFGDRVEFEHNGEIMEGKITVVSNDEFGDDSSYQIRTTEGTFFVDPEEILKKVDPSAVRDDLDFKIYDHVIFLKEGVRTTGRIARVYPLEKEYFVMEEPPSNKTWRIAEVDIIGKVTEDSHSAEVLSQEQALYDQIESGDLEPLDENQIEITWVQKNSPLGLPIPKYNEKKVSADKWLRFGFFIMMGLIIYNG